MFLGDIIKKYRKENNLSQRDFAKKCNLSYTYISALEKNKDYRSGKPISPTLETVKSVAIGMNISIDNLLKILDDNQEFTLNYNNVSKNAILVYGTIPAGIPLECIEDVIDTEEISSELLKGNKEYFGLKVKGNSMEPDYIEGDTLILLKTDDCESGDDCVVMINGNDGTFKRVFKNENGIILQPLNPEYSPLVYTNEQIENLPVKIIGIVEEIRRKKKRKK